MAAAAATNAQAATMDGATTVPAPVGMDHGRARTVQNEFQNMFVEFLTDFRDTDAEGMEQAVDGEEEDAFMFKYRRMVLEDLEFDRTGMLTVSFRDINNFSMQLETALRTQFYEVEPTLRAAVTQLVRRVRPDLIAEGPGEEQLEFGVRFVDLPECERLRDLKVDKIGHLTSFAGTVTRTSEVRPELFKGTFKCDSCFTVMDNVYQQFKYTMPVICSNTTCGNKNKFTLIKEKSTFVDWQRVKVQENTDEVPAGSLPRTMDVIMRGRGVETANPGDKMRFTGMLVVVPDVAALSSPGGVAIKSSKGDKTSAADGFTMKSSGARELTYKLMFISSSCEPPTVKTGAVNIRSDEELKSEEVLASYDASAAREVELMKADPQVYQKLTRSLCPSVYGHDSIKQAVLLMLMGGVHKKTHEGINLRGDINVAIVGDPGCAKSQILKYVANFLPRAVYTSGKASTAAGLTASVVREPENNEFAIEAGALMLADNGICCIDEFDKMDVKDQVAIHEAMEQQTISITKAGIQATLNARASILAAANPLGGRYDKSKPLKYNVALPPAILSRFDLLHVMVDDTDEAADMRIARHIIGVHCHGFHAFDTVPYKTDAIQRYIRYARSIKPQLSHEAAEKLVRMYKELRSDDAAPGTQSAYRITVRQLEALVRLSEAMARVYCQDVIKPNHVEEAARLLKSSILKIEQSDIELEDIAYPQQQAEGLGDGLQPPAPAEATAAAAAAGEDTEMADADGAAAAAEAAPAEGAQADGAVAGAAPEQDGEEAAAAQQAAAPKEKTKITAQKFNYMRTMLARKLTDVQERGAGQAEGMDEDEDGAGIRQQDLMQWYMDTQIKRKAVVGYDAAEQEMGLLFKVINKLILQNNTVAVLSKPERNPDEEEEAYEMRMQLDRVLSLHANYAPDV